MAQPSLTKKDLFRALRVKVGWGTFIFPFLYDFSPHCLHHVGDPTSDRSCPNTTTRRSDTRPYHFWLMSMSRSDNKSLRTPLRAKSVSYFHCVKPGILGKGTVHRFGPYWVVGRSITWLDWFLHVTPWENRLHFKVVASGSQQQLSLTLWFGRLYLDNLDFLNKIGKILWRQIVKPLLFVIFHGI